MNLHKIDSKKSSKGYIDGGYKMFFLEDKDRQVIDYHYHTFHKCLIVYSGQVEYSVEGENFCLGEGDILWVPSYAVHKVKITNNKSYRRCVIYISEEFLSLLDEELSGDIKEIGKSFNYYTLLENQISLDLFKNFSYGLRKKASLEKFAAFLMFCDRYFRELHGLNIDREVFVERHTKDKQPINVGISYIKTNLNTSLKVEEIAKACYLSKGYFMRKFKKTTGLTVHQYIITERLKSAREYMREGLGLTEISYKVGFNNYSTFARAFKKTYDMSPKDYLKMDPREYDGLHE